MSCKRNQRGVIRKMQERAADFFCGLFFSFFFHYNSVMFFLLIFFSLSVSFIITFPLWYFALHSQSIYTISVNAALLLLLAFLIVRYIFKNGFKNFFFLLAKFILTAAGLFFTFHFIISGHRISALFAFLSAGFVFFLVTKFFQARNTELSTDRKSDIRQGK